MTIITQIIIIIVIIMIMIIITIITITIIMTIILRSADAEALPQCSQVADLCTAGRLARRKEQPAVALQQTAPAHPHPATSLPQYPSPLGTAAARTRRKATSQRPPASQPCWPARKADMKAGKARQGRLDEFGAGWVGGERHGRGRKRILQNLTAGRSYGWVGAIA